MAARRGCAATYATNLWRGTLESGVRIPQEAVGIRILAANPHWTRDLRLSFAVTVRDPHSICRTARIRHWWADPDDLPGLPAPAAAYPSAPASAPLTGHQTEEPPLAGPLRAHARGLYPAEAGADLLINHGRWLHRRDFRDRFIHHGASITDGLTKMAEIDWPAAITALDYGNLPCSSSEQQILRLAASIADGLPVDLRDALSGLDDHNINLVITAVLRTSGQRPPPKTP